MDVSGAVAGGKTDFIDVGTLFCVFTGNELHFLKVALKTLKTLETLFPLIAIAQAKDVGGIYSSFLLQ